MYKSEYFHADEGGVIAKSATGQLEVENINAEKISINTSTGGVNIKKSGVKN